MAQLFAQLGVDSERFTAIFHSFGVRTQVARADSWFREIDSAGPPALVVVGRFVVVRNDAVRSHAELLAVVDFLIARIRSR